MAKRTNNMGTNGRGKAPAPRKVRPEDITPVIVQIEVRTLYGNVRDGRVRDKGPGATLVLEEINEETLAKVIEYQAEEAEKYRVEVAALLNGEAPKGPGGKGGG